jgi:hypothetical protein
MSYISTAVEDELTPGELATIQQIDNGGYFIYNEVPSGTINGSNNTFTLANSPNPASSITLTLNGQVLIQGSDYTLSGNTITMTTIPLTGMQLIAVFYTVAP